MSLDLTAILAFLQGIDPCVAAVVTAVIFVVKHFREGKGFSLSDLLDTLKSLIGGKPAVPGVPGSAPPAAPVVAPASESDRLLDIFANRLRDRLRKKVEAAGGDDSVAVAIYSRFVSALDAKPLKTDDSTAKQ